MFIKQHHLKTQLYVNVAVKMKQLFIIFSKVNCTKVIKEQPRPIGLGFYTTQPRSSISRQSPPSRYLFL